ncbi:MULTISPECIES: hypothetical protein [unclassified Pseudoalteromonas]|uniref:hypothetical protein n=1 Tax=unclassified Pseudoalteromonas TaxID=194690 RepID=UPI002097C4FF|nr:hypothetical protein [Pseudoalteromonas sp. XMcav2-N]MCO7191139.1 hypothetical protein [Pseudoalteromonas sp. XMcav2-N]
MAVNDILNAGVQGFEFARQSAEQAAADINKATLAQQSEQQVAQQRQLQGASGNEGVTAPVGQPPRLDEAVVDLKVAEFNAKANAQTIRTADEVLGTLIDIKV